MTTEQIEDAIISKLQTDITDLQIEGFPDSPDDYRLIHPVGAILVQYRGSDFDEPKALDTVSQTKRMDFLTVLVMRHLRSHQGAYAYLDSIRSSLRGHQITGFSKIYPVRERFLAEKNGIWWWAITFRMLGREVES